MGNVLKFQESINNDVSQIQRQIYGLRLSIIYD